MRKKTWLKLGLVSIAFLFFLCYALEIESFARVGGGRSSGFRGSRTYSAPSRSAPSSPMAPSQSYRPTPSQPAGGGLFSGGGGGFFRSMMGGIAGGFLGSMLFRGLGFGGQGGWGGGGIGFFEIILLAAILYFLYRFIKRKREQTAPQGAYYQSTGYASAGSPSFQSYEPAYAPQGESGQGSTDLQAGLGYIRQMDPYFDETRFTDMCMDTFFKIQGAWGNREMSSVRNLLTDEMYRNIQNDAERLKAEKKINKLDNIAVRTTEIVEAWQESGRDYITVRFYANLVDYTVDETSGQVVSGSKTDPVKFEEYWTFTRPVGSNPWQLSAITQP
jgi:predicted lipid-binding transport protein (Tim44 family)